MKFKYTGDLPIKDIDLVLGKVFKPNQVIYKGTIFEVPDNDTKLLQKVKLNGVYEKVETPKKIVKPKKEDKKDVKEEK